MPDIADYPLALTLERIRAYRPARPRDAEGWAAVMRVAGMLPAALTNFVYLEQWLRGDRLDLIVRLDGSGRDLLTGGRLAKASALRTALRFSPAWRRVAAVARAWQANPRLRSAISALWLEFDLDDPVARRAPDSTAEAAAATVLPAPRVFVDFTAAAAAQPAAEERHAFAAEALAPLLDGSVASGVSRKDVTASTVSQLWRLIASLPHGAQLIYVGAGHDARTARACIAGLNGDRLVDYLAAVRWPGSLDRLAACLAPLDAPPVALLHLDFTDALRPRAGLEFVLDRRSQRSGLVREQAFLDRLAERGLCDRDHGDGLRAWPGHSFELLAHAVWYSRIVRRVNHVKVVYDEREGIAAKAYLCFFHRLTRGAPLLPDRAGARIVPPPHARAAGSTAGAGAT